MKPPTWEFVVTLMAIIAVDNLDWAQHKYPHSNPVIQAAIAVLFTACCSYGAYILTRGRQ